MMEHDDFNILDDVMRVDLDEAEADFSTTKSFTEAVAKAQQEILRSFEESLVGADNLRAVVKVKEPEPA